MGNMAQQHLKTGLFPAQALVQPIKEDTSWMEQEQALILS